MPDPPTDAHLSSSFPFDDLLKDMHKKDAPYQLALIPAKASFSSRSRHRRIVRSVTPMISAAAHQVIFFAIAFNNTS